MSAHKSAHKCAQPGFDRKLLLSLAEKLPYRSSIFLLVNVSCPMFPHHHRQLLYFPYGYTLTISTVVYSRIRIPCGLGLPWTERLLFDLDSNYYPYDVFARKWILEEQSVIVHGFSKRRKGNVKVAFFGPKINRPWLTFCAGSNACAYLYYRDKTAASR
jgi:hypothetical protein